MTKEKIIEIITRGEGIDVEFKTSRVELNKDAFETICSFLNRNGGHLILGVNNTGKIEGILEDSLQSIINNLVSNANNPQKLNPPFYLSPQVVEIEEKKLIYVFVPESSQVHSTNGKIYDRNEDGDFNITNHNNLVSQLYLRKQSSYTENQIYPFVGIKNLKADLISRIRIMA